MKTFRIYPIEHCFVEIEAETLEEATQIYEKAFQKELPRLQEIDQEMINTIILRKAKLISISKMSQEDLTKQFEGNEK
jgi:hypothetical protein